MSPRAKKGPPKRGGARPGAGRPRRLEPPEDGSPEIRVRLDQASGLALLRYRQSLGVEGPSVAGAGVASAIVRELLTAWGGSAEVRAAVEAWQSERSGDGKMWFGKPVKAKKERGA